MQVHIALLLIILIHFLFVFTQGDAKAKGESFGAVESVKSANDVYAPVSFTVVEVNEKIAENAAIVNESAEADGWMIKV